MNTLAEKSVSYDKRQPSTKLSSQVVEIDDSTDNQSASLGGRIREGRKQLGLTQATLAQQTGIPLPSLKNYELGHRQPNVQALERLLDVGINVNWILKGEGPILLKDMSAEPPALHMPELRLAVETIEEALQASRRAMPPERKADMVAGVYKLYVEGEGKVEKATVLQLVKSAA